MNIFAQRRNQLMDKLEDHSYALFFSGEAIMKSEDECYPFDVNRSFYYYTGIDAEGMILLMAKRNNQITSTMFILPYDELLAKWVGGRMKGDEVKAISEVDYVRNVETFYDYLSSMYNYERSFNGLHVYFDLWRYTAKQDASLAVKLAKYISDMYPSSKVSDLHKYVSAMRMIKDETEVEHLSKAIELTRKGIEAMMHNIRPGMNEMVMEGVFNFTLMRNGCPANSFKTIAAGGKNATVLHYSENNCVLNDNELLLCDLGAQDGFYCADISRTFPVNGKFTKRQKEIYDIVLGAQLMVEANARPGLSIKELNNMVIEYYREELPKHNLMKDVSEYYFHGIGHMLGLDTHDISNSDRDIVLKPGMVMTNEPGLYIEDECLGIRIEDDILITDDGCINLSANIIKTTEDIEKFMKR